MLTTGQFSDPNGLSSITVRPFHPRTVRYTCDSILLFVRGATQGQVEIGYSENAGMSEAGRRTVGNETVVTLVRQAGYRGEFTVQVTDGAHLDTLFCPDLYYTSPGRIRLAVVMQDIDPRTALTIDSADQPRTLLVKWYRDGIRLDDVSSRGTAAFSIPDPPLGHYHAVVMTDGYCTTVTDTLEIVATSVAENSGTYTEPVQIEVFDVIGRIIHRVECTDCSDALASVCRTYNRVYVRVTNKQGRPA